MAESQSLTIHHPLSLAVWTTIQAVAPAMHASRFFGISSPEQAMAIALKGHELGLGIGASFEFIIPVMGKPSLSPRGALAIVMNSGLLTGFKLTKHENPIGYTCWMKRANGFEHEETFTIEDARRAGLVKQDGAWQTYPFNLSKWRAIGFCIDVLFSDVCGGLKRSDEFGAVVNDNGDVIEGQWNAAPVVEAPPAPSTVALSDLTDRFGAEAVMTASMEVIGQPLPATNEDVLKVATKLAGA